MNLITEPHESGETPITKKQIAVRKIENQEVNDYSRTYENSPTFPFSNSALTSGSEEMIDIWEDKPESRKYGAMNVITIANGSTENILFYPNQDKSRYFNIPAGSIRILDKEVLNSGVRSFIIKNNGTGTAAAGTITTEVSKKAVTTETILQNIHKKIFQFGRK